ncbi:MAG: isoprenylcysteine carboxylmethyltransferase family protein [Candidatus Lokiarchaeota archaeon]|nr:isoprenylcysteine carboxylmethyltransferase family protein [Candidatus Lokiarchaeota archaeon]
MMLNWINLIVLILSTALMAFFYIKSVYPATLAQKIGLKAYARCAYYRITASIFELVAILNYLFYFFLPLPIPILQFFIWDYWISIFIAFVILFPSLYIMLKGVKDAGREALFPDKEHILYSGIYEKIRHPQALGEAFIWWSVALILNSPFLFLYSIVWFPLFYWFCRAEEKDLIVRYGEPYMEYRKHTGMFIPRTKHKNESTNS